MTSLETEESGHCREIVAIERFKQESMLQTVCQKKMAVEEMWLLWRGGH